MDDLDFDSRELCPDGACVGVIGADNRCKVCGARGAGETPYRAVDPVGEPEEPAVAETPADPSSEEAFEDEDRQLCPDGTCIGVLDRDGRCKVCGARA